MRDMNRKVLLFFIAFVIACSGNISVNAQGKIVRGIGKGILYSLSKNGGTPPSVTVHSPSPIIPKYDPSKFPPITLGNKDSLLRRSILSNDSLQQCLSSSAIAKQYISKQKINDVYPVCDQYLQEEDTIAAMRELKKEFPSPRAKCIYGILQVRNGTPYDSVVAGLKLIGEASRSGDEMARSFGQQVLNQHTQATIIKINELTSPHK